MKARKGYKKQKSIWNIGRWLKRYFTKRTCRQKDLIDATNISKNRSARAIREYLDWKELSEEEQRVNLDYNIIKIKEDS